MNEEQYPYNLPPWRRKHEILSPDGNYTAKIYEAWELSMSGPTYGKLFIEDIFRIENCSPTFIWSNDSRYLAVAQWCGVLTKKEKLLVLDINQKKIYSSKKKFKLLILNNFVNGIITMTQSPLWKPREVTVSLEEVEQKYKISTDLIQGTPSLSPKDY